MLSDKDIRELLEKDPNWEPKDDASDEEWELYDQIYEELYPQSASNVDDDDDDDDAWDLDDDDDNQY